MVTAPMRELLRKDIAWTWEEPQRTSFSETKKLLTSTAVVSYYDPNLPTTMLTDASKLFGLGFALVQHDGNGRIRLIQCGSRSLTDAETRYAPSEQECLTIQWAISKAKHYLLGNPGFRVVTDHKPLLGIFEKNLCDIDNRRLQRLREKLTSFKFDLEWVEGKSHLIADALSRYPTDQPSSKTAILASIKNDNQDVDKFALNCYADETYKPLLDAVKTLTLQQLKTCLLYTSPSPRDKRQSRMPSSA